MPQLTAQLLAQLVDRHGAALKLFARGWCSVPDDIVQQALIELAACAELPSNPVAWLFTVVRRRAISQARLDRRRRQHEQAAGAQWFEYSQTRHATAAVAAIALAELPLADREIVIAHLWGRLTFAEIANLVGTSASTAQRRFEAAINRLRTKLNPDTTPYLQAES
ncbi:MAG TPA: sigma-70 family RNA polymerase sigma factor [Pirellulales bacterium]|jgi:RNA polymerase sigma-70 factor (ECF subfamily)|nr:sigma-70 family RNA polymerase sigma factor [Pirellulales bacterium]